MSGFTVEHINLSMEDVDFGTPLQANVYHVDGIYNEKGGLRDLSIGQLVMAICLSRASDLEKAIINQMTKMSRISNNLEVLTQIQEALVNSGSMTFPADFKLYCVYYDDDGNPAPIFDNTSGDPITGDATSNAQFAEFCSKAGITIENKSYDDLISEFTTKMNSLNSVSQTDMIQLQSLTSKRDQSYDLISNVLKSLQNVLLANANNL